MARVLVVEDNDLLGISYEMVLRHHGQDVVMATNGQAGLNELERFQPDVILLDYLMPIMDGKHFLLAFRPAEHPETKVVLLSNLDDRDRLDEAFALGIHSHLLKASLTPSALAAHVEQLLR
jgi:two-component system response regulator AdeR